MCFFSSAWPWTLGAVLETGSDASGAAAGCWLAACDRPASASLPSSLHSPLSPFSPSSSVGLSSQITKLPSESAAGATSDAGATGPPVTSTLRADVDGAIIVSPSNSCSPGSEKERSGPAGGACGPCAGGDGRGGGTGCEVLLSLSATDCTGQKEGIINSSVEKMSRAGPAQHRAGIYRRRGGARGQVQPLMSAEGGADGKGLAARAASKGPLARVCARMGAQVGLLAEGLPAHLGCKTNVLKILKSSIDQSVTQVWCTSQLKGRSPVCSMACVLRCERLLKALPHSKQVCGRLLLWTRWCARSPDLSACCISATARVRVACSDVWRLYWRHR